MRILLVSLVGLIGLVSFSCSETTKSIDAKPIIIKEEHKKGTTIELDKNDSSKEELNYEIVSDTSVFYSSDTIRIQSLKRVTNSWKGANGGLKISLKEKVDTLFDGSYGLVPDYEIIPSDYGLRLFTRATHNGGGNNDESWCIVNLGYNTFLDTIYIESINTGTEKRGDSSYWYNCFKELSFASDMKTFKIQVDSVCTKVDESKGYKTDTLSKGIRTKKIKLR